MTYITSAGIAADFMARAFTISDWTPEREALFGILMRKMDRKPEKPKPMLCIAPPADEAVKSGPKAIPRVATTVGKIYRVVRDNPGFGRREITAIVVDKWPRRTGYSSTCMGRALRCLRADGHIRSEGPERAQRYFVVEGDGSND